ncbi:hypothetical protein SCHPADRAFT_902390 [Schizopora paradoxa]|uniref:Secreted protein n=1 Tax=Schizopora paradoxa TaxID=27342 RepID=A0A0H2SE86_9AGAM|nr:hypothetical protein SCHPADRAFT_902390 [Schizopora paradoxa]
MRRPRPLACPLFCIKIVMCQWDPPPSFGGLVVDLRSTDIEIGRLVGSARPFGVPSYPCAGRGRGVHRRGWWAAFMPRKG